MKLGKKGFSRTAVFCTLNNGYLNYFKGTFKKKPVGKQPDGSYNLQRAFSVKQDDKSVTIHFHGSEQRVLVAPNPAVARRWFQCIQKRRAWYSDITTSAESFLKLRSLEASQRNEMQRQADDHRIQAEQAKALKETQEREARELKEQEAHVGDWDDLMGAPASSASAPPAYSEQPASTTSGKNDMSPAEFRRGMAAAGVHVDDEDMERMYHEAQSGPPHTQVEEADPLADLIM